VSGEHPPATRIAVVGNCQAGQIVRLLQGLPADRCALECRHVVAYQDPRPGDREFVESADRILVQVTDFNQRNDPLKDLGEAGGRRIAFPLLAAHLLYPFASKVHPRNPESRSAYYPAGHYEAQVSDQHLIGMMAASPEADPKALVERFLAEDYRKLLDLDRLYELNRHKMERIGRAAGLDLWPVFERSFRHQPAFWTVAHPAGFLLERLFRFVLESLDLGIASADVEAAIAAVFAARDEPLGFVHMPIHPSVSDHFGIDWAHPERRYRYFVEGSFDIRTFFERFVRFEFDDEVYRVAHELGEGADADTLIPRLLAARGRLPGSPDVHDLLGHAYARKGLLPEAIESATTAVSLAPGRRDLVANLCVWSRMSRIPPAAAVPTNSVPDGTASLLELGRSYTISKANPSVVYSLASGWGAPEEWGVWSVGTSAHLRIALGVVGEGAIKLGLGILPFVPQGAGELVVEVWIDGHVEDVWRFGQRDYTAGGVRRRIPLLDAQAPRSPDGHVDVRFVVRNPRSPASLGINADARLLGFGLTSLFFDTADAPVAAPLLRERFGTGSLIGRVAAAMRLS